MLQAEPQGLRTLYDPPALLAAILPIPDDPSLEVASTTATLVPRGRDPYLKPIAVVGRIKEAFAYVEASQDGARRHVLEWMNQLAFVAPGGRAAEHDEYLDQLERLQDEAFLIHFGDDISSDGVLVSMLMIPGQPLVVDYSLRFDRARVETLIARCAAALKYDIMEERSMGADATACGGAVSTYATLRAAA